MGIGSPVLAGACVITAAILAGCSSSSGTTSKGAPSSDAGAADASASDGVGGALDADDAALASDALSDTSADAGDTEAGGGPDASGVSADGGPSSVAYPLKASANGRYLVDQNGRPFLMSGDAPQSLVVNVSESDADRYFADRKAHGYSSVWINLLCNTYTAARSDGTTYDGLAPFTTPGDLATPNDAYFTRADHMVRLAAKYDLNVLFDPAETGGWLSILAANGVAKDRTYGQYVGNRYKSFDNIVWMSGNDFQTWRTAGDDAAVSAVALGIKAFDTPPIHTLELAYNTSSSSDDPPCLPVTFLHPPYTHNPTYAQVLKSYNRASPLPVFLVEGVYEFESNAQAHQATTATLRRQEYWTNLSGATGQLYGSHYTWTFASGWQGMLDSPGATQMPYVKAVFGSRAWHALVPDVN